MGFLNGPGILELPGLRRDAVSFTRVAVQLAGDLIPFLDLDCDRVSGRFYLFICLFAARIHMRE